jgi:hypothetical protein
MTPVSGSNEIGIIDPSWGIEMASKSLTGSRTPSRTSSCPPRADDRMMRAAALTVRKISHGREKVYGSIP